MLPLRALEVNDAVLLAALHAACFPPFENWSEQSFAKLLEQPEVFGWRIGDEAFLLARVVAGEAELLTLAVSPALRRHGFARQLAHEFLQEAKRRHAEDIFLEVAEDNTAAQGLYASLGFQHVGRRPDYYPGRRAAFVLRYISNA